MERNNKIIAVWPYKVETLAGLKVSRALPLTPHLGPLISPDFAQEANVIGTELLMKIKRDLFFFNQTLPSNLDKPIFADAQIPMVKESKQIIHLNKKSDLLNNVSSRKRRYIKAFKDSVIVRSDDPQILNRFSLAAHKRRNVKQPFSLSTLQKILAFSTEGSSTSLFYLYSASQIPLAGTLILQDQNRCYLLCSGWNPQHKQNGALSALVWNGIQRAANDVAIFDFHGSLDPGISRFNHSMGAVDETYFRVRKSNRLIDALKQIK